LNTSAGSIVPLRLNITLYCLEIDQNEQQ